MSRDKEEKAKKLVAISAVICEDFFTLSDAVADHISCAAAAFHSETASKYPLAPFSRSGMLTVCEQKSPAHLPLGAATELYTCER